MKRTNKLMAIIVLLGATISAVVGIGAADHALADGESADLQVTITAPSSAQPGDTVTYHVEVSNNGPSPATSVTLTDNLPAEATFLSGIQTSGPPFDCTPPAGPTGTFVCTAPTLGPSESAQLDISVQLPSSGGGTVVTNGVTVTSATPDPLPHNDWAYAFVSVEGSADLSLTMSGPGGVLPGGVAIFTITVVNAGPQATGPVGISDVIPAGTSFAYSFQTSGPLFTCDNGSTAVFCYTAFLGSGESATLSVAFAVPADTPFGSTVDNGASVTAGYPGDRDLTDNSAVSTTTVMGCRDGWRLVTDNDGLPFRNLGDCQRFLHGGGQQR